MASDWSGPPDMVGGHVTGPLFLAREQRLVIAVRQVMAYPNGVEIDVIARAFGPAEPDGKQWPEFWVRLADGTEVVQDDEYWLRSGTGPTLMLSNASRSWGDPDNRADLRGSLWLWPLPGPITLGVRWPVRGLADTSVELDGDAIAAAANRAVPFWSD